MEGMMSLRKFFDQFKRNTETSLTDPVPQAVDEALTAERHRLHAVDAQTDGEWKRLRTSLLTGEVEGRKPPKFVRAINLRPAITVAVAVVMLVVIGVVWFTRPSVRTYETTRGEQATIVLPDSSEVTLNHTSELSVSHFPLEYARRVTLHGEAFFRVRHNGIPFIVSTDVGTVRVLGTEFNVRSRSGRLEVGVVQGNVQVTYGSDGADSSVVLAADQIVVCTNRGFLGKPVTFPFSDYPGWTHGKFLFYHSDLASACRELESQFDVSVTIQEPKLLSVTITGAVDGRNVEAALATLARLTGSEYRHESSGYILY